MTTAREEFRELVKATVASRIATRTAADHQRRWVADVSYYLCLSAYEGLGRSCAVLDDGGTTVGHVMWAVDPEERVGLATEP